MIGTDGTLPLASRVALADAIRRHRHTVASRVTDDFFHRHPDWQERYGERGRRLGVEDALFHIDHLAGAVESGRAESYEAYARWSARTLEARGIAPAFLAENLAQIGAVLRDYLSTGEHRLVDSFVAAASSACAPADPPEQPDADDSDLAPFRGLYLRAILGGDRRTAASVALQALRGAVSVLDVYVQVIQASQYEVGRLWETNRISVAQEHLATAITQFVLAQTYSQIRPAEVSRGRMVLTGVEGELHQVGANMVADVLEAEGWDVQFLGTHMPHAGILSAIEEHEAEVLGISATMLFNLPKVRELTEQVRHRFGSGVRVVVGGPAFRLAPSVYAELGADGYAGDLHSTVRLLCGK